MAPTDSDPKPAAAAAAAAASTSSSTTTNPLGRNPLPLSARQEGQVRDIFYKRVRTKCAQEIKDFAACAHGRTFSSGIACRPQRLTMNKCMMAYDTLQERDAAREEWFATIDQRAAERADKERKRLEALAQRRLYYGVPEEGDEEILRNAKSKS